MIWLTNENVKKYVENNPHKVSYKSTSDPNKFVLKYKRKVYYSNLWDDYLVEMRGTIVDKDFNPLVMPFRKSFNYMERPQDKIDRDETVYAERKVNGFMAAATYHKETDEVIVSTTGSIDSEFATKLAMDYLAPLLYDIKRVYKNRKAVDTLLFEIVHPLDPHIVLEQHAAYLIGARPVMWNAQVQPDLDKLAELAKELNVPRPKGSYIRFSDIVKSLETCTHEGYMVYGQSSGKVLKLKSPYYRVTKRFGRMTNEKLFKIQGQSLSSLELRVYRHIIDNVETFINKDEHEKIKFIREFLDTQPEYMVHE